MPDGVAPDTRILQAAVEALRGSGPFVTPSAQVAARLAHHGVAVHVADETGWASAGAAGIALLDDELSAAADHAEGMIAAAVAAVGPGGVVAVSAVSALHAGPGVRGYRGDELGRSLGHHGIDVTLLCAPGAAGIVRGDPAAAYDPELDRRAGLLDAAPRLLAVGRVAATAADRSAAFFATLPYKVVAAGVLCLDAQKRLLVVHDTFKGWWTIPGGVVDADEDPRAAAEREAWEEAGTAVRAGEVAGVFSASWPDRVVLVYRAQVREDAAHLHHAVHAHEIDEVAWVPLDEALDRLAPHVAEQVRHCLSDPGQTLRQRLA